MILGVPLGSIVEQVVGSLLGVVVGVWLAEIGWRSARKYLPSALRSTADRLSGSGVKPESASGRAPAALRSVFEAPSGPPQIDTVRRAPPRVTNGSAQESVGGESPRLQVRLANGEASSVAIPPFGALVVGSGDRSHIQVPGLAPSAAMFQLSRGKLTLAVLDPTAAAIVDGRPYQGGEIEFPIGTELELEGASIGRLS